MQIILLAQTKEFLTMYIFDVRGFKCPGRYFLTEYCDILTVSFMGQNGGILSNVLRIFDTPCLLAR